MDSKGAIKSDDWLRKLIGFCVVVAFLYLGREMLVPLTLSLLMAFLLKPLVSWLHRHGLPRVPAVLTTFTLTFLLLAALLFQVGNELASLANELPKYKTELLSKIKGIRVWEKNLEGIFGDFGSELNGETEAKRPMPSELSSNNAVQIVSGQAASSSQPESSQAATNLETGVESSQIVVAGTDPSTPLYVVETKQKSIFLQSWAESVGILLGPLGTAGLVLVFTLFLMVYQEDLRDRMIKLFSGGQYVTTTRALNESAERISGYLIAQAIINFSYGGIISLGLWIIGLWLGGDHGFPNVLVWGILCAILRFIPYIGPVISSLFPLAIALAVFPGFSVFAAVLCLIVLVELISNNVLEPWLYGSRTGLSAMAIIFASVFWGWIWGPIGLLLATPLTVCLVVLGKHFDAFRHFHTFLGDDEPLPLATRFYQRLLAGNCADALRLAKNQAKTESFLSFLDSTLIPTIALIRSDREAGRLARADEQNLNVSLDEILSTLIEKDELPTQVMETKSRLPARARSGTSSDYSQAQLDSDDAAEDLRVLLLPAHHKYEELVLSQLSDCIKSATERQPLFADMVLETLTTRHSTGVLQQALKNFPPKIAVIGIVPPGGLLQAEYLCEVIQSCSADCQILVAWFGKPRKFDRLLVRLRRQGVSYVATSIEQTINYIESIIESRQAENLSKRKSHQASTLVAAANENEDKSSVN